MLSQNTYVTGSTRLTEFGKKLDLAQD